MELISIVVPIYNVDKYLLRCVNSVLAQTYTNLEVILVDDGSTDNSGTICDELRASDQRVEVIHKKNGGLSDARNNGIEKARGQFITFVDSDDVTDKKYVETLYQNLVSYDADISMMRYKRFQNVSELDNIKEMHEEVKIYSPENTLELLLYTPEIIPQSACGKMYRRNLFDGIRYPVGRHSEDIGTTYRLIGNSKKCVCSNMQYYFYFQRPGSIVRSAFTEKTMDAIYFAEEIIGYAEREFPSIKKAAICFALSQNIQALVKLPYKDERFRKYKVCIYENIKKYRNIVFLDPKATWQRRIGAFSTYGGLGISQKFGRLYKIIVNHETVI